MFVYSIWIFEDFLAVTEIETKHSRSGNEGEPMNQLPSLVMRWKMQSVLHFEV